MRVKETFIPNWSGLRSSTAVTGNWAQGFLIDMRLGSMPVLVGNGVVGNFEEQEGEGGERKE